MPTKKRTEPQIPVLRHRFNGLDFDVAFFPFPDGKLGGTSGRRARRRRMGIDSRLREWQLIEVLIHEGLHACFDKRLSEREVLRVGEDLTSFIDRALQAVLPPRGETKKKGQTMPHKRAPGKKARRGSNRRRGRKSKPPVPESGTPPTPDTKDEKK